MTTQVRALARGLQILDRLGQRDGESSMTELSRELGLDIATVFRLLATLESNGFVVRNPDTGRFRIGSKVIEIAQRQIEGLDLRSVARPFMERLRELTGETVVLYVASGHQRTCIEGVESHQRIRSVAQVGLSHPLLIGATGMVLAAFRAPAQIDRLLVEALPEPLTPETLTEQEALRRILDEVRRQGFCITSNQTAMGLTAVAIPVRDRTGQVIAALGITGPSDRWNPESIRPHLPAILAIGEELSAALGS